MVTLSCKGPLHKRLRLCQHHCTTTDISRLARCSIVARSRRMPVCRKEPGPSLEKHPFGRVKISISLPVCCGQLQKLTLIQKASASPCTPCRRRTVNKRRLSGLHRNTTAEEEGCQERCMPTCSVSHSFSVKSDFTSGTCIDDHSAMQSRTSFQCQLCPHTQPVALPASSGQSKLPHHPPGLTASQGLNHTLAAPICAAIVLGKQAHSARPLCLLRQLLAESHIAELLFCAPARIVL